MGRVDGKFSGICRMNRAACYLRLGELNFCVADCDYVIGELDREEDAVKDGRHADPDGWRRLLIKALARRASALAKLGAPLMDIYILLDT
jgi:hypothetical protein